MNERGILTVTAGSYHDDQLDERPSLSASIAHLLCTASPAHARAAHPRLNRTYRREEKKKFDVGIAAHAMLLEGRDIVTVVDAANWTTKAAREARDDARAQGRIPLLPHEFGDVELMVLAVREQLTQHHADPPLFTAGLPEQTLVWEEDGVVCRARVDWLRDDHRTCDDLKTTTRSANPESWSRTLFSIGCDVQAAFYLRGVRALTGATPEFRWCVAESAAPYALSVVSPAPDVLELAHRKVGYAIRLWRDCLTTEQWPGYPTDTCYANVPPYEEARWLERVAILEEAA